jgi:site-specific recombinase XerD
MITYQEFNGEKYVKVKNIIIFLDDLLDEENLDRSQQNMVSAIKGFFKRMIKNGS